MVVIYEATTTSLFFKSL